MGVYRLKRTTNNQFYFTLHAGNGEVILTSERYATKQGAQNGIESVKVNSPHDDRYVRKTSQDNKPMFNLTAVNGQVIGTSETYSSTQAREAGIASVKSSGPGSPTIDQT